MNANLDGVKLIKISTLLCTSVAFLFIQGETGSLDRLWRKGSSFIPPHLFIDIHASEYGTFHTISPIFLRLERGFPPLSNNFECLISVYFCKIMDVRSRFPPLSNNSECLISVYFCKIRDVRRGFPPLSNNSECLISVYFCKIRDVRRGFPPLSNNSECLISVYFCKIRDVRRGIYPTLSPSFTQEASIK